tara:strand:- start:4044 stop:5291 length:1248 start_codon:yes stop_codon:yes gene_type:complete
MANSYQEKRSAAASELQQILTAEDVTDEQYARAEQLDQEITGLDETIKEHKEKMAERAERALSKPTIEFTGTSKAASSSSEVDEYMRWFNSGGRESTRSMAVTSAAVPNDLSAELVSRIPESSAVRQCSAVDVMAVTDETGWSYVSSNTTAVRLNTGGASIGATDLGLGRNDWSRKIKYGARTILDNEFIQDVKPAAVSEILGNHGAQLGLIAESAYINGLGEMASGGYDDSDGIMVSKAQFAAGPRYSTGTEPNRECSEQAYVDTNQTTQVQSVLATPYKLDAAFWGIPGAWIVGPVFYRELLTMVDGNDRPIFQSWNDANMANGLSVGNIFGRPVYVSSHAPVATGSEGEWATGDVVATYLTNSSYRIGDLLPITTRLNTEEYGSQDQSQYISTLRTDARFSALGRGVCYLIK